MMFCTNRSGWRSLLLAPVIAAGLLVGCASPDDGNGSSQVSTLTGTITGTILTTNGAPIAGATVRYNGASGNGAVLTATTNADGQFQMPGVIVSGVAGATINDANGPITLAIAPPAGYMGATVQVIPQAQSTGSVGGGTVFIDNFNIGIGTVKLPALATTVSGTLRDGTTGNAVAGVALSLDFQGVEFDQDGTTTGVASTYDSGSNLLTTSASDGSFTFTGVYSDSCVNLSAANLAITSITGSHPVCSSTGVSKDTNTVNFNTTIESGTVNLANVVVSGFATGDTVPPFVASVDGVVDPTQTPAQLESSVTTTFNVHFSETMASGLLDPSKVTVVLGTSPNLQSATVSSVTLNGGNTAVITLANALPASTAVSVDIAREALQDTSGNSIALNSAIAYNSFTSQDLVLSFESFSPTSTVANAATVVQVSSQAVAGDAVYASTDALVDTVDSANSTINPALTPASVSTPYPSQAAIEQLNNPAAAAALNALKSAIAPSDRRTVNTGTARVNVSVPANATDFLVWIERSGAKLDALFYPVVTGGGNPQNTAAVSNNGPTYVISPNGASQFDLVMAGDGSGVVLQPGDVFHITSRNAGGVLGGTSTATLTDIGRPTVALQLLNAVIAGNASGGGGGVVTPGNGAATVLLSVTPQAADINDTTSGYTNDNWRGPQELQGLSHPELQNSTFATGLSSGNRAVGDADGTASFINGTAPSLGIAITEPGSYTGTAPTLSNITAGLSNFSVANNVTNEDGSTSNLLVAQVSNVFQLAANATGNTAQIDITASIRDANNVVPDSATHAIVQLRDSMPPLMTLGFYDGTNFTFQFNEAISKQGSITFAATGCQVSVSLTASGVTQPNPKTIVFPASLVVVSNISSCFALPAYAESAYTAAALSGLTTVTPNPTPPHGAVSYTNVPDVAVDPVTGVVGNTWTLWTNQNLGIGAPYFAVANIKPTS